MTSSRGDKSPRRCPRASMVIRSPPGKLQTRFPSQTSVRRASVDDVFAFDLHGSKSIRQAPLAFQLYLSLPQSPTSFRISGQGVSKVSHAAVVSNLNSTCPTSIRDSRSTSISMPEGSGVPDARPVESSTANNVTRHIRLEPPEKLSRGITTDGQHLSLTQL